MKYSIAYKLDTDINSYPAFLSYMYTYVHLHNLRSCTIVSEKNFSESANTIDTFNNSCLYPQTGMFLDVECSTQVAYDKVLHTHEISNAIVHKYGDKLHAVYIDSLAAHCKFFIEYPDYQTHNYYCGILIKKLFHKYTENPDELCFTLKDVRFGSSWANNKKRDERSIFLYNYITSREFTNYNFLIHRGILNIKALTSKSDDIAKCSKKELKYPINKLSRLLLSLNDKNKD